MPDFNFQSPGANFTGGFEDYLMKQRAAEHQNMLDDLAQKREQRLAQAELDSMKEHQDTLAEKRANDLENQHAKKVKDFQTHVEKDYVANDRPLPEDVKTAQDLGLNVFRQAPPAMSAPAITPPAALMETPPAGATPEGSTSISTNPADAVTPPGTMAPGATVYPGSAQERLKAAQLKMQQDYVSGLDDSDPRKAQWKAELDAEAHGLKTPAGFAPKAAGAGDGETIAKQNPRTGKIEVMGPGGQWTPFEGTTLPKGTHWMTEPAPKDTTARDLAAESALQRTREHAFKRIDDEVGKATLAQITTSGDIANALSQNTEVADATLAPLVLKATITRGGNSGFRMTKPEIDRVLTRDAWDDLALKLHSWTGSGPLQLNDSQKAAMRKLASSIYDKASKSYARILDAEQNINHHAHDTDINDEVTKLKRDFAGSEKDTFYNASDIGKKQGPPAVKGEIVFGSNGMPLPAVTQ